jgi:hypothetical protein
LYFYSQVKVVSNFHAATSVQFGEFGTRLGGGLPSRALVRQEANGGTAAIILLFLLLSYLTRHDPPESWFKPLYYCPYRQGECAGTRRRVVCKQTPAARHSSGKISFDGDGWYQFSGALLRVSRSCRQIVPGPRQAVGSRANG